MKVDPASDAGRGAARGRRRARPPRPGPADGDGASPPAASPRPVDPASDALQAPVAGGPVPMPAWVSGPRVPVRTIAATIAIVLATAAGLELLLALHRLLGLLVIASFLAVVLSPAVSGLVRVGLRRSLATTVVFLVGMVVFGGLGYLFIHPLYQQALKLSNNLPDLLAKTQAGKGSLGRLIARYHMQKYAATEAPKIRHWAGNLGGPAIRLARHVVAGIGGLLAILVLTFLLLLEGPGLVGSVLSALPPVQARRVRAILNDVAKSVTGYVIGNAATSVIAGLVCLIALLLLGVPYAVVFGVWVALVDLLPLVGGLLAGVPTVAFAFLHDPTAGVITLVVFLVYQQLENHILNPVIMSRTVKLNPLWVILSVLAGAEMAGIVGALLAIPVAGAIQVIARDLWDERRGQFRLRPTEGPEHRPIV